MTFETEETREKFHKLPAQQQLEYCELEIYLARQGKRVHIESIFKLLEKPELGSEILVRIIDKF